MHHVEQNETVKATGRRGGGSLKRHHFGNHHVSSDKISVCFLPPKIFFELVAPGLYRQLVCLSGCFLWPFKMLREMYVPAKSM